MVKNDDGVIEIVNRNPGFLTSELFLELGSKQPQFGEWVASSPTTSWNSLAASSLIR